MKYLLDLSNVKKSNLPRIVLDFKIPCKTGMHQLAFDLIECDIPKNIYAAMVRHNPNKGDAERFPIGFDNIPVGATLIRVE